MTLRLLSTGNYFKKLLYLLVFNCFSLSYAGSYDDFFAAIVSDDEVVVKTLLQRGFDPNTIDPAGQHGLILALKSQSLKVTAVLAQSRGIKIEVRNKADESPLMLAALVGDLPLSRLLIEKDADVNKPGWTPLHYAATNGHVDVMNLLLDENAYIDAASPNGTTPLMMAAQYGTPPAVKLLLEAGADPLLKNDQGLSALEFANLGSRTESARIISAFVRGLQPKGKW
jgi:ankyrin repeat protein